MIVNEPAASFSDKQWQFLTTLHISGQAVPADIIDALAPLPPGPLLSLMAPGGPVRTDDQGHLSLSPNLPDILKKHLTARATPLFARKLLERLSAHPALSGVDRLMRINLLIAAKRDGDALKLDLDSARKSLDGNDYDRALEIYANAIQRLESALEETRNKSLFVSIVLEFSNVALLAGKGLQQVFALLKKSGQVTDSIGDQRNRAMVHLHIGRILFLSGREPEALVALEKGADKVNELGDPDILSQASVFIGFYHFIKGHHKTAMEFLETALSGSDELEGMQFRPMARIVFGFATAFLGHFHRSIGTLDFSWQLAKRKKHYTMASVIGAVLGIVLVAAGKMDDGWERLNQARQDALDVGNRLGLNLALRGLAYCHFLKGGMAEAAGLIARIKEQSSQEGLGFQFMTPWLLEMHTRLEELGFSDVCRWRFDEAFDRIMRNPNIHIQGVALRLRAERLMSAGTPGQEILPLLIQSEACLEKSGDPIQLANCQFALARMHLQSEDQGNAGLYARKGYRITTRFEQILVPADLEALLRDQMPVSGAIETDTGIPELLIAAIGRLDYKTPPDDFLNRVLFTLNRFIQDERAGIFWNKSHGKPHPTLRAGRNLTGIEVAAKDFESGMALICRTHADGVPRQQDFGPPREKAASRRPRSILCLPIKIGDTVQGVLYHDSSYLDIQRRPMDQKSLVRIANCLGTTIARALEYDQLVEETRAGTIEKTVRATLPHDHELLAKSPEMMHILEQAGKVAATDVSVLLHGETGTGKEVLARWIHERSRQRDKPFIVIEPAVIPENIVESELFGHERGAFTGADRQKTGLVELAHGGTLFIDEVGEIPPLIQVKLLRVLQDKAFTRVGGTKTIRSDFRLLAATNRNLHREVSAGRFREDLYYRLNVVELALPPLRERKEDIGFLARHFLALYSRKYHRDGLGLTKKSEQLLTGYHWPGNVRELQNIMERAMLLSPGNRLTLDLSVLPRISDHEKLFQDLPTMDEMQWRYIQHVVRKTGGKIGGKGGAAEILGMKRTTLQARIKKLERL